MVCRFRSRCRATARSAFFDATLHAARTIAFSASAIMFPPARKRTTIRQRRVAAPRGPLSSETLHVISRIASEKRVRVNRTYRFILSRTTELTFAFEAEILICIAFPFISGWTKKQPPLETSRVESTILQSFVCPTSQFCVDPLYIDRAISRHSKNAKFEVRNRGTIEIHQRVFVTAFVRTWLACRSRHALTSVVTRRNQVIPAKAGIQKKEQIPSHWI